MHQTVPDLPRLEGLLTLAGPIGAADLLARLEEDLTRAQTDLETAFANRNVAALRAVTHVLISVAGALGAEPLTSQARALNEAAKGASWPTDLPVSATDALRDLAAVIGVLRRRRANGGRG